MLSLRFDGISVCLKSRHAWLALALAMVPVQFSYCQVKIETSQQVNDQIRRLAALDRVKPVDAVIGTGDVLHIDVFGVPDLSRDVRVDEMGQFTFPLIPGKIEAGGLTPYQLQEQIEQLLESNGLVTNPQVSVFVKEQYSQTVSIIGAVNRPQVIQVLRPTSLLELIADAGGIAEDAGAIVLVVRQKPGTESNASEESSWRDSGAELNTSAPEVKAVSAKLPANKNSTTQNDLNGGISTTTPDTATATAGAPAAPLGETIRIRLSDLLDSGDPTFNIPVKGGDVVSVPRSGVVYVAGAVQAPGGYVLQDRGEQVTTAKLIALAHGWTSTAKPNDAVIVRVNPTTGKKEEIPVKLKAILARKTDDVRLFPNDLLIIPDSTGKKVLYRGLESTVGIGTGVATYRAVYQ